MISFRYLLLWNALTNPETEYAYSTEIKERLDKYILVGKRFNCTNDENGDIVTHDEEIIDITYGWVYELILKKDKLVVFEVSNEFEVTEEVAFRNIERGQTESGKWERDDVADYVVKGEKVLNNAMLFKLFEENSDFQIEKVKINELGKTFCYIVSRNSQSKQKDNSSFEEAIRTAVKNQDIKLEVKRGGERYDDLVMRKPLSFLAESDLDWRNQKVILLPFGKSDYFMITHSHKDNAQPEDYSKSMFLEKIKRNAIWNRAIEYVMMQQNSTFRKTREIIEQEYEEVCRLIYDAAVDFDGSY